MEAPEEDAEFLTLACPTQGVTLRVTPQPYSLSNGTNTPAKQFTWSNHFGYSVIANPSTGFSLFELSTLRQSYQSAQPHSTPSITPSVQVQTNQTVDHVKFAMGDKMLLAGMRDGTVAIWRFKSLIEGNFSPLQTIPPSGPPSPIVSILPNPSPSSPLICILSSSPSSPPIIYNLETSSLHSTFPSDLHATSSSWSVKGKQLVFGTLSGQIQQFTPEAQLKASLPLPSSLVEQGGEWQVKSLDWLENHVFLVTYGRPGKEGQGVVHEDEVLVVTRDPKSGEIKEEVRFLDPCPAFGMMDLKAGNRFIRNLKNWSPFKQLLFVSSTPSSDIGLISQSLSNSQWSSLILSDTSRPTLPQSSSGEEVAPLGMELDLSNNGEMSVWCLTSEGVLVCWKIGNEKSEGPYEGLIKSKDVLTQEHDEEEGKVEENTKPPTQVTTPSAFATFSSTPSTSEPTKPNPTGFGQSGFGSSFASTTPSAFGGQPSIASPSATKPTFGQSSGFGSFASSTPNPSSSTPAPTATSGGFGAFGSSTGGGGFSAFGSSGTTPTSSGFGSLATSQKPSTGGGSVFGSGGNAFGSSSTTPSVFGASSTPSAFGGGGGSKTTTTKSVFGGPSTSTTPMFGTSTSSSSPAPASTFSFASKDSTLPISSRPRGGMDSDDEEEEDRGMGQADDGGGGRVDEPPDLEPTKSGLDIGESMREAQVAKKRTEEGGGTFGFGGLGVGGGQVKPKDENKVNSSVFGASTTPAFGKSSSPAFGGSSIKPPTGFSFGQSSQSSPVQTPKPAAPTTPQPGPTKLEEQPKAAATSTGFSFGSSTTTPFSSGFPKTVTTGGFGGFSSGTGGFGSSTSSSTGGFGSFATPFPAAKIEEKKVEEETKPKSAFGAFGSVPSPSSGGFAGFGAAKKEEEKDKEVIEKKEEVKKEEPVKSSPFSLTSTPAATSSTSSAPTSAPTPSSAFGSSGTASTGFPKPTSTGGFGSLSSPSTAGGGGFGSFSSSSATGGFGSFASSSSNAPKPATGFSFAASNTTKPSSPSPAPAPAPAFSFAPVPKKEEAEGSISEPKKIEEKKDENGKSVSTKSLFGFASSPTEEKEVDTSLLSRLSAEKGTDDEESENEDELGSEGERGESYDENEGEFNEDDGEPYDEEQDYDEDERQYGEHEEGESEIRVKEEEREETIPPSSSPSLLSRLSPAPKAVEPPSPAASPSPPPVESKPTESKPPTFSFASPTTPASPTPSPPLTTSDSTTPTQAPATEKSPFCFASSPTTSKPSSFLGFTSSAPRSSSPLSAPPLAAPPAFSSAPKISSPLSFAPPPGTSSGPKKEEKSSFGGFSGFGSSTSTSLAAPAKLAPSPGFSFGPPSAPTTPPAQSPAPKPSASGFSFGSTPTPSTPPPAPESKPSSTGFSFSSSTPPVETPKVAKPEPPAPVEEKSSIPPPPKERVGISLANAQTPKVGPELVKGAEPAVQEKGMAGEFLKAYLSVQRDFEILRTNALVIKEFAKEISGPLQPKDFKEGERAEYDDRKWSMGDLERLKQLTKQLRPSVEALHGEAVKQKRKTAELQSQMLKAETKREEAARFVRAKNDPAFAKMVRIRQLGPEQIENQRKIRAQMEAVRSRVEQLEDHLLALKTKVLEDQKGRSSFKAPSLDSVNRAVRNITVAVTEKTVELDELAQKLDQIRLGSSDGTPQRRQMRHRSPSVALEETLNQSSVLRQSSASNGTKLAPSPGSIALAKAALEAEKATQVLKQKLLDQRSNKPLKINRSASAIVQNKKASVAADLQLNFAKAPITADRLPRPRRQSPPPSPQTLSPIPLLPTFKPSPAPIRSSSYTSPVETPKPSTSTPVATPKQSLSFSTAPPPSFSLPTSSAAPAPLSFGGGPLPSFSAAPPPSMNFGGLPSTSTSAPPPLFPSLALKAAPQFSFGASPPTFTPPSSSSGTRGSAARTSKDRNHSSAAQLKPSSGTPPAAASSFDWGPLPSNLSGATPSKPPAPSPFSFGGGNSSTPSQGISPSGFVSLGSPFAPTNKPATTALGGGGFSFGTPSAPIPSTTPSKPPAKFSFGAPAEEESSSDSDEDEAEQPELEGGKTGPVNEEGEGDHEGEYEDEDEEWDGQEDYSEEEGLDTIGEEEEYDE